jgi:hypothetical protein
MITLLVNLLIFCLIVAILYWMATLIAPRLPAPLQIVPMIIVAVVALVFHGRYFN